MAALPTITEALQAAVESSGKPLFRIAQKAGIDPASLNRFMRGVRSLRLDKADLLAAHFGLTLQAASRERPKHR
jgi:hypothetical protein